MSVAVNRGDKVENIADVDSVLLAIGRSPNTEELNLPAVVSTLNVRFCVRFFPVKRRSQTIQELIVRNPFSLNR
jgi:pyruvate/2-oxoglutarate dehydrogenase complex dihydrolipoamide dehydrogenase (E3) component